MKGLIISTLVVIVIGGIVLNQPTTSEYVRESSEEEITAVPEVVEVDVIEKRIEKAQAEAMKEIDAKADTLRGEFVANELKKIESAVLKEIQAELKERQISADKKTGGY